MTTSRNALAPYLRWTPTEDQLMREIYPDVPCADIAALLGRGPSGVYQAAYRLGLKKSASFFASDLSGRVTRGKQCAEMMHTRFKPGSEPWNKGTHFVAGGRSAETRFKKGRTPTESLNYLPIGTLRLSKDGYLERKMTDDQSVYPARRWSFVHRLVWVAANGPVAAGHMVIFRPGKFTNDVDLLTADRLDCISRAENVRRNSLWRKDPELVGLYQLKSAITRQVNRIKETTTNV